MIRFEQPDEPTVGDLRRTFWDDTLLAIAVWDGTRWRDPLELLRWREVPPELADHPRLRERTFRKRKRFIH